MDINTITDKALQGLDITEAEAYALLEALPGHRQHIYAAAEAVTRRWGSRRFDSCSIINARSGRCGEDCKWCAQAAAWDTDIDTYPLVDRDTCLEMGRRNAQAGIGRFSLVTSGRTVGGETLERICGYYRDLKAQGSPYLCASMGLLGPADMLKLRQAGVQRYHCNLETAASHFPTLCSTHTQAQKLATIDAARAAGMEICSGGIIGMGESMRQRVEFALDLRRARPVSIPVNVLQPIPGTPLENEPPLTDSEILDTLALMRLIHPRAVLRFAGGRARISPQVQRQALRMAVGGAIMGDMLTTIGAQIDQDKKLIAECGYEF